MFERDPEDRRYPERLAGSYLGSLLLHTALAALLFSIVANTANEGATESVAGGSIVTLEQRTPVVASVPARTVQAAPMPFAPRVAPVRHAHAARPAAQPHIPLPHELAKIVPSAPPNPTPLPQASAEPNPVPTQAVYEPVPSNDLPAVPVVVPTAAAIAVTVKIPPTAAPSPVPSSVPTQAPSAKPIPTAAPTTKAATPAPPQASAAPTTAPVVAKASAAPSASPSAAVSQASAPPSLKAGVPSPSPTQGASTVSTSQGLSPSPGPKGQSSPGPKPGNSGQSKGGSERPISVRPTPAAGSSSSGSTTPAKSNVPDISGYLRSLLPHNAVNPTQGTYHPPIGINGSMDPTPPPDVLQATRYIFEERGAGNDALDKMWVTSVHGGTCDGWLVRYPTNPGSRSTFGNGTQISIGGGSHPGVLRPVIEGVTSVRCSRRELTPFGPSPAPSP